MLEKNLKKVFIFTLLFTLSLVSFAEDINIGVILPLSGPIAVFGQSTIKGLELAINEINTLGGVNGKSVKLFIEDNKGDSAESVAAIKKLISVNKVKAIIGCVTSTNTLAVAPIAQKAKVPLITPTATNIKVTQMGDYIARACFIDPFQGQVMGNFAAKKLNKKTAVIFKDMNSDYSEGLAKEFINTFTALGGEILDEVNYIANDMDYSSQITKLRKLNPEVVFLPGYYNDVALILKQANDLKIESIFLGGDGWENMKLLEIAGNNANGNFFSTAFSKESDSKKVQDFIENYYNEYFDDPNSFSALGYDAVSLMVNAIKAAGSTDGEKIKDAMAKTKNFEGITGNITLDQNRNAIKKAIIMKIDMSSFKYETEVEPS